MSGRQIRILPGFTGYMEGVICFETKVDRDTVNDLTLFAFEHEGAGYTSFDPGALRLFHERILLGQDMPPVLVLTKWYCYDQIMAAAIFMMPSLVLEPSCTNLVNSLDLIDRLGPPGYGHIPYEHKELIYTLRNITEPYIENQAPVEKILDILTQAASVLINYVQEGTLPPLEVPKPEYRVLASQGPFVAFEADDYVWDQLYAEGYLCGIWFRRGHALISKKSPLVSGLAEDKVLEGMRATYPGLEWCLEGQVVSGSGVPLDMRDEIISNIQGFLLG